MAINDRIYQSLASYGGGTINERVYNYLGSLGYTGTINERLSKYEHEGKKGWQGIQKGFGLSNAPGFVRHKLFGQGQQGVMYVPQPSYLGNQVLYQDSAGTTPVTADGDPVGLMLDSSRGLELGPELFSGDFSVFIQTEDGWTITPEKLVCDGIDSLEFVAAEFGDTGTYKEIRFTISNYSSGTLYISHSNGSIDSEPYQSDGDFTARIMHRVGSTSKIFFRSENFAGEITELSIKEVAGNHATQSTSAARPIYRTDGVLHWLAFDGVDDKLSIPNSKSIFVFMHNWSGATTSAAINNFSDASAHVIGTARVGDSSTRGSSVFITSGPRIGANVSSGDGVDGYAQARSSSGAPSLGTRSVVSSVFDDSEMIVQLGGQITDTTPRPSLTSQLDSTYDYSIGRTGNNDFAVEMDYYGSATTSSILGSQGLATLENYLAKLAGIAL